VGFVRNEYPEVDKVEWTGIIPIAINICVDTGVVLRADAHTWSVIEPQGSALTDSRLEITYIWGYGTQDSFSRDATLEPITVHLNQHFISMAPPRAPQNIVGRILLSNFSPPVKPAGSMKVTFIQCLRCGE
jgi:hypothetical protein